VSAGKRIPDRRAAVRQLQSTMTRFEHAREPDIIFRNVSWPAFENFLAAIKALQAASHPYPESQSVRDALRRWIAARDLLLSSFVAPNHPSLNLGAEELWGPPADGELGRIQIQTRELVRALHAERHHGLLALGEMITNRSRIRWPRAGKTRVIVKPRAVGGTLDALNGLDSPEGISWEVLPLFTARQSGPCDVTIVLGPAEKHSDWRIPVAERSRHVAWLFNAPMSPHIIVISWGGSSTFNSELYESNPNNPQLDARVLSDVGFTQNLFSVLPDEEESVAVWSPADETASAEAVRCRDFLLPDNRWISFGIDAGPKPLRIPHDSEYEIDIVDQHRANHVDIGDIFILLEGTQDRHLRDVYCADWLKERQAANFETVRKTVSDYKAAIWSRRHDPVFKTALDRAGLRVSQPQAQISRANPGDPAIGPRYEDDFNRIATVAGWFPPHDAWEHVRLLRGGYSYAGRRIREQLLGVVRSDHSWHDDIIAKQIAVLDVPNLGRVTLAPILAIVPGESQRDPEDLGRLRRR